MCIYIYYQNKRVYVYIYIYTRGYGMCIVYIQIYNVGIYIDMDSNGCISFLQQNGLMIDVMVYMC